MFLRVVVVVIAWLAFAPFAAADVKADLLASHEAMMKAGKFRMTGYTETKGKRDELWTEVHWPDRYHARNAGGEFILLPGKTYMKQGGQWMAMPMDMSAMASSFAPEAMHQMFDNMTNAKDLGETTLEGRTVRAYEYDTFVTMMGFKAQSHVKVYIDPETNLVVRQESDTEAGRQQSKVVQEYEYDPSISIDAPM